MKIKKLIFVIYGDKEYTYKLYGYSLPLGMGGSEKSLIYSILLLKDFNFDISIALNRISSEDLKNYKDSKIKLIPLKEKEKSLKEFIDKEIDKKEFESICFFIYNRIPTVFFLKLFYPKIKVILLLEGSFKLCAWDSFGAFERFIVLLISFPTILMADKILVDNKRNILFKIPCLRKKMAFFPVAINKDVFSNDLLKESNSNGHKNLLYSGRLNAKEKNPKLLFKAFEEILKMRDDITLSVAGIENHILESLIKKYSFKRKDKIISLGKLQNESMPEIYRKADLLLVTSKTEGGSPNVILEALACGTPVISTKAIDPGVIIDGINGYVAKNFNPKGYATLVLKALEAIDKKNLKDKNLVNPRYEPRFKLRRLKKLFV
jgi:glycosyltransferase involved in cell wall biosynthesis